MTGPIYHDYRFLLRSPHDRSCGATVVDARSGRQYFDGELSPIGVTVALSYDKGKIGLVHIVDATQRLETEFRDGLWRLRGMSARVYLSSGVPVGFTLDQTIILEMGGLCSTFQHR